MKHKKNSKTDTTLRMIQSYFPQVEMVKDARHKAIVEVTEQDNAHADVKSHRTCALAIACKRFFHADGVIIGLTTSWIIINKTAMRFHNAATVSREITSFDRKAGFDAGNYLLVPASKSSQLGRPHIAPPWNGDRSRSKPRQFRHYTRNVRSTLRGHARPIV